MACRFSDGFDTTPKPRAAPWGPPGTAYTPGGTATVQVDAPGYDAAWYARVVEDAGDKYRVPAAGLSPPPPPPPPPPPRPNRPAYSGLRHG